MKSFAILLCLISTSAFAETCFQPSKPVSGRLPPELCYDSAQIVHPGAGAILEIKGGSLAGTYLGEESASAGDRIIYKLAAQKNLRNEWNGSCGGGEIVNILVEAYYDESSASLSSHQMKVQVEETSTSDTCHSEPQTEVIPYLVN